MKGLGKMMESHTHFSWCPSLNHAGKPELFLSFGIPKFGLAASDLGGSQSRGKGNI